MALNRLMQVAADAMLPVAFDVPPSGGSPAMQAQIADVWYCDGSAGGTARAVVVVLPSGVKVPRRMASQGDCGSGTLDALMSRLTALSPRPADWIAAAFLTASYSAGHINLTFTKTSSNVKPGASLPAGIAALLAQTGAPFRSIDTANVTLTVRGKAQTFTLAFLFQPAATAVFGFPQPGQIPAALSMPPDVSLANLPAAANCILRVGHAQAKQELSGPLAGLTFPLQAGGQTFTVSNLHIDGGTDRYQTSGTVSYMAFQLHPAINWAGADLGFRDVQLAEAQVTCGNLDAVCKAKKQAAQNLQGTLNTFAPHGKPLRPLSAKDVNQFQNSGRTFALRVTVLRSSSTNDSLQLASFLSVVPQ